MHFNPRRLSFAVADVRRASVWICFALLSAALLMPLRAKACSCVLNGTPQQELGRSSVVFEGTVVSVEEIPAAADRSHPHLSAARLRVTHAWKGVEGDEVVVETFHGMCGVRFEVGESYLVYANETERDNPWTDDCTRTCLLSAAAADLAAFRGGEEESLIRPARRSGAGRIELVGRPVEPSPAPAESAATDQGSGGCTLGAGSPSAWLLLLLLACIRCRAKPTPI